LIVSFAVFWIVKVLTKMNVRQDAAPAAPPKSEVLLGEIRDLLKEKSLTLVGEAAASPTNRPQ
jgi:large conductance mechanosensitive channel